MLLCLNSSSVESREFGCGAETTPRSFMSCVKKFQVDYRLHGGISQPGFERMR